MALTKKQKQVYDYIYYYVNDNSYAPTQSEIKEHFGFRSLGSVQDYIRYLTNAGYLKNDSNAVRGLEPMVPLEDKIPDMPGVITLPLLGSVAAGEPIEKFEENQTVEVPENLVGLGDHYALQIQGESMIEDGILDGDIVILKHQKNVENGQTAVVLVNGAATIKRFYNHTHHIELRPANEKMSPIIVDHNNWEVSGILVGLFRNY